MSKRNQVTQARKRGWKQWTPAKAHRELSEWRKSGLPLATFAKKHGYTAKRLRWWCDRLSGKSGAELGAKASEVTPQFVPAVVTAPLVALNGAAVTIRMPGGQVLEIADVNAVPARWVGNLLAAAARVSR
jgi:hypothetical protein